MISAGRPIGSRYELEEPLGRGAFGSVWRARVRDTGEPVAVKVLREELASDPDIVTRFLRERTALMALRHPSLVAIRDLVVEGELLALVMQLVNGPDLKAYLAARGRLSPQEAAMLVAEVSDAIAVAHLSGIVHRDVKPANVLLAPADGGLRPLLTDFGVAKLADQPSVTRTHQVVGTPYYLAPEVVRGGGNAESAVDVYAAGVMLYELCAGHPPFRGPDASTVLRMHLDALPQRPPGIPDAIWSVICSAMAKQAWQRPDAAALAVRLRAAVPSSAAMGPAIPAAVNGSAGTMRLPHVPPGDLALAVAATREQQRVHNGHALGVAGAAAAGAVAGAAAMDAAHAPLPAQMAAQAAPTQRLPYTAAPGPVPGWDAPPTPDAYGALRPSQPRPQRPPAQTRLMPEPVPAAAPPRQRPPSRPDYEPEERRPAPRPAYEPDERRPAARPKIRPVKRARSLFRLIGFLIKTAILLAIAGAIYEVGVQLHWFRPQPALGWFDAWFRNHQVLLHRRH